VPATQIVFYMEDDGSVPVMRWLKELRRRDARAFAKCAIRIERLAQQGHDLRRPESDYLRDGIHELRIRLGSVNYRILYFFHGGIASVLVHSLTKEDKVPEADIERAVERKSRFERDPERHRHYEERPITDL